MCFLPSFSRASAEENVWHGVKRLISSFKIDKIPNYTKLKKEESESLLKDLISKFFFYQIVESKNKWNKVLNNYIKPKIKLFNPNENLEWEVRKIY